MMELAAAARESLTETCKRLRSSLRAGKMAELHVAIEVVRLAKNWAHHKAEAGGTTIERWLLANVDPTQTLSWYCSRADAHDWFKPTGMLARLEPQGILWMHRKRMSRWILQRPSRRLTGRTGRTEMPLKGTQVRLVLEHHTASGRCRQRMEEENRALKARIARLEAQIRKVGMEPVE